jgi:flagellar M-ring protein FliF
VDGIWTQAADGSRQYQPRPADELAQLAALVRSAAGVDEERGDVVEVVSRPFVQSEPEPPVEPGLLDLGRDELARLAEIAGLALLALAVLLFGVRPLVRSLRPREPGAEEPAAGAAETIAHPRSAAAELPPPSGEPVAALVDATAASAAGGESPRDALRRRVAEVVAQRPDDAVRVIRTWLQQR